MKRKTTISFLILASVLILVTACGSKTEVNEPVIIGEKNEVNEEREEMKEEVNEPSVEVETREQALSFTHIHGLSFHPLDKNKLLLASHHGLIEYNKELNVAYYIGTELFDLMGYSRIPNSSILMTSGHPGEGSSLPDPLGFLWSEDFGETWEARGLHGQIDFHALTATIDKQKILGYGSDYKKHAIMQSNDQGFTWEVLKTKGLPLEHDEFFDMSLVPNNGNVAYAATSKGLFISTDGGINWQRKYDGFITALYVIGEDDIIFYEARELGLLRLKGNEILDYQLFLGRDAVLYLTLNDDQNPDQVIAATFGNDILETENSGESWHVLVKEGNF